MREPTLDFSVDGSAAVQLADDLPNWHSNERTLRRGRSSPYWRSTADESMPNYRIAVMASLCPRLIDAFIDVAKVIERRPDESLVPQFLVARLGKYHQPADVLLVLAALESAGVVSKRYRVLNQETKQYATLFFETLEQIPERIENDPLVKDFDVSTGIVEHVYTWNA
jgi:hypothetical protein